MSHHGGVASFGDKIEEIVEQGPCGAVYLALEECLGEQDRDWRKCQRQVQALSECNRRERAAKAATAAAAAQDGAAQ